jgi:hypothetical protein
MGVLRAGPGAGRGMPVSIDTDESWCQCLDQLESLRLLADNWDGDGAIPIPQEIADTAECYVLELRRSGHAPPTAIVASPAGNVVIEWDSVTRYVEAEIEAPGVIELMEKRLGYETIHSRELVEVCRE